MPSRYLQHWLVERKAELVPALRDGAVVLACGEGAPAVRRAVEDLCGASAFRQLVAEGRYVEDVWGG